MTDSGTTRSRHRAWTIGVPVIAALVLTVVVVLATRPTPKSYMPVVRPGVTADPRFPSTTVVSAVGLAPGVGRMTGRVGPGRPDANGVIPTLRLTFSDGQTTVKTTVRVGAYTVDLPAGRWEVHSDDGNICVTGLQVIAGAAQSNDLIWPSGNCQDLSGPPASPSPPAEPTPPRQGTG